jgi:hypothetical protein
MDKLNKKKYIYKRIQVYFSDNKEDLALLKKLEDRKESGTTNKAIKYLLDFALKIEEMGYVIEDNKLVKIERTVIAEGLTRSIVNSNKSIKGSPKLITDTTGSLALSSLPQLVLLVY